MLTFPLIYFANKKLCRKAMLRQSFILVYLRLSESLFFRQFYA